MAGLAPKNVHGLYRGVLNSGEFHNSPGMLDTLSVRGLLEKLKDGCVVTDSSGVIHFLNRGAAQFLGIPRNEALGHSFQELFTLLDGKTRQRVSNPCAHLVRRASLRSCDSSELFMRRDGRIIPFDYSISFLNGDKSSRSRLLLFMLRDASRTHARIEELVDAVRHDEHTKLLRRGELERRLSRVLKTISAGDHHALLFMDLDRFKAVNDCAGHAVGDRVLLEVAEVFRMQVRERDTLARMGGDEFALLLEHCPPAQARSRARALHSAIANHIFEADGHRFTLGVSIGVVSVQRRHATVKEVLAAADVACYAAKRKPGSASHIEESVLS